MCCTQLAGNAGPKNSPSGHNCSTLSSQLRHVSAINKNLLNTNISPTRPHSMVGPLTAEIHSGVWGTPSNFNGFCILAARHSSNGRQPNFVALNRWRHLYSAGRPSRWASAHILVFLLFSSLTFFFEYRPAPFPTFML